jgi:hypothetical protein
MTKDEAEDLVLEFEHAVCSRELERTNYSIKYVRELRARIIAALTAVRKGPPSDLVGKNPNFPHIKPCANCGAMPCPPGVFMDDQWGIRCSWCSTMQSRAKTRRMAVVGWNRRTHGEQT